jgi:hypothetical protein
MNNSEILKKEIEYFSSSMKYLISRELITIDLLKNEYNCGKQSLMKTCWFDV